MTKWHRTRRGDLGLRAAGLGLCALAYVSIVQVTRPHAAHPVQSTPGLAAYVLTAVGVLSASAGSAMTALGAHLFDEIVISERWRVKPNDDHGAAVDSLTTGHEYRPQSPAVQAVGRYDDRRGAGTMVPIAMVDWAARVDAALVTHSRPR